MLAASAGAWLRPGDATFAMPRWPAAVRPYAWGSRFFAQEADRSGDLLVPRFVEASSARLWPFLVSGPLMEAGGQSVAEGWQDLQRRSSRLASIDGEGEMLVRGLRAEPHPRLATDGRHLAYLQVDGKHPAQVVVRDLVTGRVVAHRTVNGSADFAWVNESLVVSQLDYGSPVELRSDLYW